jgi:hypothetical protein
MALDQPQRSECNVGAMNPQLRKLLWLRTLAARVKMTGEVYPRMKFLSGMEFRHFGRKIVIG